MIYGEIKIDESYYNFYHELLTYIKNNYKNVESGLQGDAYIWIKNNNEKVTLDTFTSMRFEIKSNVKNGTLVQEVINTLKKYYPVSIYPEPELEAHDT